MRTFIQTTMYLLVVVVLPIVVGMKSIVKIVVFIYHNVVVDGITDYLDGRIKDIDIGRRRKRKRERKGK